MQSHFESHLPTLTMFDNFSETLHFCTQTVVVQRFWKQYVALTYHSNEAMMRPTPMQSTKTTHNKNFKNPINGIWSAIAKPIDDTVKKDKESPVTTRITPLKNNQIKNKVITAY